MERIEQRRGRGNPDGRSDQMSWFPRTGLSYACCPFTLKMKFQFEHYLKGVVRAFILRWEDPRESELRNATI